MKEIKILQRVAEIERDRYSKSGHYSVTDLINPPRVVHLRKRHDHEVTAPLASVIPAIMGTAIHNYFEECLRKWVEKHKYKNYTFEKQLSSEFQVDDGEMRDVSGRFDILDGLDLYDIKTCKVWKLIYDPMMVEWVQQQNLYDYLCWLSGIDLNSINIMAVYKDWQEGNALRSSDYPQDQVCEYKLTRWSREQQAEFLKKRLAIHYAEEKTLDDNLPQCTREERWERHPDGSQVHYAVFKTQTAKRASRVFKGGTLEDALSQAHVVKGLNSNSFMEIRYARRTRCEKYCSVKEFCNDYKDYARKVQGDTLNDYVQVIP